MARADHVGDGSDDRGRRISRPCLSDEPGREAGSSPCRSGRALAAGRRFRVHLHDRPAATIAVVPMRLDPSAGVAAAGIWPTAAYGLAPPDVVWESARNRRSALEPGDALPCEPLEAEITRAPGDRECWVVTAVGPDPDGAAQVTTFAGPGAWDRAVEYGTAKYARCTIHG